MIAIVLEIRGSVAYMGFLLRYGKCFAISDSEEVDHEQSQFARGDFDGMHRDQLILPQERVA